MNSFALLGNSTMKFSSGKILTFDLSKRIQVYPFKVLSFQRVLNHTQRGFGFFGWKFGQSRGFGVVAFSLASEVRNLSISVEKFVNGSNFEKIYVRNGVGFNGDKVLEGTSSSAKLIFKPTISLSILDSYLQECKGFKHFAQIFSQMVLTGFLSDTFAASRLIKITTDSLPFVDINYCHRILTHIESPNGFIFNTMMRAYVKRNAPHMVLCLYKDMLNGNVGGDNHTYPLLVQASALRMAVVEGKMVHCHVVRLGFDLDVYVKNTLINMYGVCGDLRGSRKVFDESSVLDSVSWNSMLAVYVNAGDVEEARHVFVKMPERNVIACNSMIVLFGRSGNVSEAFKLFSEMKVKDLVSWSALISCFEQNDMYEEALVTFRKMNKHGVRVDEVVLVSALSACARLSVLTTGMLIHSLVVKIGVEIYVNLQNALTHMYSCCGEIGSAEKLFNSGYNLDLISWNSMISGYMKCGSIEKAENLFANLSEKDVVSWGAMISGYAQHDKFSEALELFLEMQVKGTVPDMNILVSVVSACTHMAALDQGKWIHAYIRKNGIRINAILGTTLVDMYMKLGCVENAMEVFNEMEEKGVSTWNALILGFAMNGLVDKSLEVFSEMKKRGAMPNEITFVGVLGACRHMGLVDEGYHHFNSMMQEYSIEPNVKHYGCMVDLLGRAGQLKEAEKLLESMPISPDVATWGALLGACKKHGDHEMGERVGRKLVELQPDHDGFHVLLSNIRASKGSWDDVLDIRGSMYQRGVVKVPGCSMIEANGAVHEFLAGDRTHPQIMEIEYMLDEMSNRLKLQGYAPETHEVLLDISEEEKETTLFRHSEKLAIAFGLMTISPPTPIRIIKNLRICNDCHTAAKFISKAFDREIVVRDRHRFHHFNQGACSCKDYW